ncbi:hypothetical protein V2J09_010985 [Rumex salicifolius]
MESDGRTNSRGEDGSGGRRGSETRENGGRRKRDEEEVGLFSRGAKEASNLWKLGFSRGQLEAWKRRIWRGSFVGHEEEAFLGLQLSCVEVKKKVRRGSVHDDDEQ